MSSSNKREYQLRSQDAHSTSKNQPTNKLKNRPTNQRDKNVVVHKPRKNAGRLVHPSKQHKSVTHNSKKVINGFGKFGRKKPRRSKIGGAIPKKYKYATAGAIGLIALGGGAAVVSETNKSHDTVSNKSADQTSSQHQGTLHFGKSSHHAHHKHHSGSKEEKNLNGLLNDNNHSSKSKKANSLTKNIDNLLQEATGSTGVSLKSLLSAADNSISMANELGNDSNNKDTSIKKLAEGQNANAKATQPENTSAAVLPIGSTAVTNTNNANSGVAPVSSTQPANPNSGATPPVIPSNPNSGSTGPVTPSNPNSGSTGPVTPSNPNSGSTEPVTPSNPNSGSTEPVTPSNPNSGSTGPVTPSNPNSGSTEPVTPSNPNSGSSETPVNPGSSATPITPSNPNSGASNTPTNPNSSSTPSNPGSAASSDSIPTSSASSSASSSAASSASSSATSSGTNTPASSSATSSANSSAASSAASSASSSATSSTGSQASSSASSSATSDMIQTSATTGAAKDNNSSNQVPIAENISLISSNGNSQNGNGLGINVASSGKYIITGTINLSGHKSLAVRKTVTVTNGGTLNDSDKNTAITNQVNATPVTVTAGQNLPIFDKMTASTADGMSLTGLDNGGGITINEPGTYKLTFTVGNTRVTREVTVTKK